MPELFGATPTSPPKKHLSVHGRFPSHRKGGNRILPGYRLGMMEVTKVTMTTRMRQQLQFRRWSWMPWCVVGSLGYSAFCTTAIQWSGTESKQSALINTDCRFVGSWACFVVLVRTDVLYLIVGSVCSEVFHGNALEGKVSVDSGRHWAATAWTVDLDQVANAIGIDACMAIEYSSFGVKVMFVVGQLGQDSRTRFWRCGLLILLLQTTPAVYLFL